MIKERKSMSGGRLSGKMPGRPARSLADTRNPWDGFEGRTTHGQGDGGRNTGSAKGTKASGRHEKAVSDVHRSGRHSGHQGGGLGDGQDGVRSHGRGRQGLAGASSGRQEVRGGGLDQQKERYRESGRHERPANRKPQGPVVMSIQTIRQACKISDLVARDDLVDQIANLEDLN